MIGELHMMLSSPDSLHIEADNQTVIVRLHGPRLRDAAALSDCSARIRAFLSRGDYRRVVFDLEDVEIAGTRILSLLMVREAGYRVRISRASDPVKNVLAVTRLDTLFAFGAQ